MQLNPLPDLTGGRGCTDLPQKARAEPRVALPWPANTSFPTTVPGGLSTGSPGCHFGTAVLPPSTQTPPRNRRPAAEGVREGCNGISLLLLLWEWLLLPCPRRGAAGGCAGASPQGTGKEQVSGVALDPSSSYGFY